MLYPVYETLREFPVKLSTVMATIPWALRNRLFLLKLTEIKISNVTGMDICICTSAKKDEHCRLLLEEMGMPFRK